MDILNDEYLKDIYENLHLPEDEYAFFIPDYIFNQLIAIIKKYYPWNFKILKNKNKFIFYEEISQENPFLFFESYDENDLENCPETEIELAEINQESTLIE